ncbi:hypothetical protein EV426DRAFT_708000 [Tirmania nivea]|nr:hypothetical protein EV426DRAFT_708000 [Tirmania nivea]
MPGAKPGIDLWDHISFDTTRYWRRSQAAAYILRPNTATMEQLRGMRLNNAGYPGKHHKLLNIGWEYPTANTPQYRDVSMPFLLPRGSFSLHVRHEDKGIEMKLVDFPRYVKTAEDFV